MEPGVAPATVQSILVNARADFALFQVIEVERSLTSIAKQLVIRHRLRTMDAIHLASAMSPGATDRITLVSADRELLAAAALEGLAVV